MKRLHYLLLLLVGLLASCSLSFDSLVDEPTADDDGIENNGDGFTAPRHVTSSTLNAPVSYTPLQLPTTLRVSTSSDAGSCITHHT